MNSRVTPLPPGTVAPDFALQQSPRHTLQLRRHASSRMVLVFHPMPFEPVSREQLILYQDFLPQFEDLGAKLVGISVDHVWCQVAFAQESGVRFPLLSDGPPRGQVSQLYGVYREEEEVSARALFVIDESGTIRFSEAYPDLLNPGVDELLTVLEHLSPPEDPKAL